MSRETEREREVERYKIKLKESWHSVGKIERERRLHMTGVLFVYYAIEQSANLTTATTTMTSVVQQTGTRRRNVNSSKSCRHQCK